MKKAEKKDYVFKALLTLLAPKGYYLVKTGLDPHFILKGSKTVQKFFFNFKDAGDIAFSMMQISIREVEAVIREVGMPDFDPVAFEDGKKYFLTTVEDKVTVAPKNLDSGLGYPVETPADLEFITGWILRYLQNEGEEFVIKYSYLPNVLAGMDRLEAEGLTWHDRSCGVLSGTLDAYFRGLIISKLCNDSNFEMKILKMNDKFNEPKYVEWLPFYEKLKERLKTLEPVYNI